MSTAVDTLTAGKKRRGIAGRVWAGVVPAWAVITGVAPHVLHHVGPLAGAALLAGYGGKAIFFALGLVLSLPLLRRLYHRFETWRAPALAVLVFVGMFAFSSLVLAPWITGTDKPSSPVIQQPADHAGHHSDSK
jgi:hypothetical protein